MRLKLGRPDIETYADRFDVPPASGSISVTFLGVASLLLDDGESAVMTDGFFSRPPLVKVALGKLAPDTERIDSALARVGVDRLDAVVPVHTHYDHALDSAVVAERTGAVLAGGESAANVGRGHGLPEDRIRVVTPGEPITYGAFTLTLVESHHCPPDRSPGPIEEPVVPPVKMATYRCGEAWSILVEHTSGRTALLQGSAGFVRDALTGRSAEVAYLGVGQLGVQSEDYIRAYWAETVEAVGARRVVLTHWDDFFRPLDQPLRALPYAGDDLDATVRVLDELGRQQGVPIHFPTAWRREDPWAEGWGFHSARQEHVMANATTVTGVIDRMREIGSGLEPADGVLVFNTVYLHVTERIGRLLDEGGTFEDEDAMTELDVRFAGMWLTAHDRAEAGHEVPKPWAPLFAAGIAAGCSPSSSRSRG